MVEEFVHHKHFGSLIAPMMLQRLPTNSESPLSSQLDIPWAAPLLNLCGRDTSIEFAD
jgi:hypothetical protein